MPLVRAVAVVLTLLAPVLLALGGAGCAGCAGCAKDEGTKAPPADDLVGTGKEELGLKETERGLQICDRYVARLCACAEKTPSPALESDCRLARSMPEALRMQLRAVNGDSLDAGPVSAREGAELEAQARKTIAICVRKDGELDPAVCPR